MLHEPKELWRKKYNISGFGEYEFSLEITDDFVNYLILERGHPTHFIKRDASLDIARAIAEHQGYELVKKL